MLALVPTLLAVLAGIGLGLGLGGTLSNAPRWRPQIWPVAGAGVALELLIRITSMSGGIAVFVDVVATALLVIWCAANLRTPGVVVILAGLVLNLVPTVLNWGMPVSRDAVAAAGLVTGGSIDETRLEGPRHLADGDVLGFLGENIALPTGQVLSIGDLVLHLGYVLAIAAVLRGRRLRADPDLPTIPYRQAIRALGDGPMPRRGPGTHPSQSAAARRPKPDDVGVRRLPRDRSPDDDDGDDGLRARRSSRR
jgi:hypothetical protein